MMRHACVSLAVARDGRVECHQTFEHVLRKNRFASNVLRAVARPRKPSQSDALVQSAEHKSSIRDNDCEERFRSGEAMSRRADTHLFVRTSRTRPRGEDQRSSQHVRCVRRPIDGETRCQPTITDKSIYPSTIRFRRVASRSATSRRGWEAAPRIFSFSLARALGCSGYAPARRRCRPHGVRVSTERSGPPCSWLCCKI